MSPEEYTCSSIALNLFWTRILREHAIFVETALSPVEKPAAGQAAAFRRKFDFFLRETISLADGVLPESLLHSGQFYTKFTAQAEREMEKATGLDLNVGLTAAETRIQPASSDAQFSAPQQQILTRLNHRILDLAILFLRFLGELGQRRADCALALGFYPSVLNHFINEGKQYQRDLERLLFEWEEENGDIVTFWNGGMSEHAKSLRGELDWTETGAMEEANAFAQLYDALLAAPVNFEKSLETTARFRGFAHQTCQGLSACTLKGIMSLLYTDHLLREVIHYEDWLRSL